MEMPKGQVREVRVSRGELQKEQGKRKHRNKVKGADGSMGKMTIWQYVASVTGTRRVDDGEYG